MGILVQQRKTPLGLWGHSPSRIREYLANEPGSYYYYPGSQSIVASNEPGVAHDLHHTETVLVQVRAQGPRQACDLSACHEPELAICMRGTGDGMDWGVWIARSQRQDLQGVPADDPLSGSQPRFAPVLINIRVIGATADRDSGQRIPDGSG